MADIPDKLDRPDKAERLAAALRANLRKRKAQAREHGVGAGSPAKAGVQSGEDSGG